MKYLRIKMMVLVFSLIAISSPSQKINRDDCLKFDFYLKRGNSCKKIDRPKLFDRDFYFRSKDEVLLNGKKYFRQAFPIEEGSIAENRLKSYLRVSGDSVFYFSDFLNGNGLKEQLLFISNPMSIGSKWVVKNFYSTGLANFSLSLKSVEWVNGQIIYTYSIMDYYYSISYQRYWLNEISYNANEKCFCRIEYSSIIQNEKLVLQNENSPFLFKVEASPTKRPLKKEK